ncbi:MAG: hypothetical protein RR370_03900, partial [Synergistaceae bacterium]
MNLCGVQWLDLGFDLSFALAPQSSYGYNIKQSTHNKGTIKMAEIKFILEEKYQYPIMYMYKKIRKAIQPHIKEEETYKIQYCSCKAEEQEIKVDTKEKIIYLPEKKLSILWCKTYIQTAQKETEITEPEKQMINKMTQLAEKIETAEEIIEWDETHCDPGTIKGIEIPDITEKMKELTEKTNSLFLEKISLH